MGKIFVEQRDVSAGVALTWDLALHLYARNIDGNVVMVTENPSVLLSAVRKQWLKVMRRLNAERASTLDSRRRLEIDNNIHRMEARRFVLNGRDAQMGHAVFFVTPLYAIELARSCHTCYVVLPWKDAPLVTTISKQMKRHSLIVDYGGKIGKNYEVRNRI